MQTKLILVSFLVQISCFAQTKADKIDELLRAYHSVSQFNGNVLVFEKGKVILQSGYGYQDVEAKALNNNNTIFQVGSITKQFTAVIILKLAEQGKVSLNDKLSRFYPDYIKADSITIHQLLNHTSGIYNYTNDAPFMKNRVTNPATEEDMFALFSKKDLDFPPGSAFRYSNSGYHVLGAIIQKIMHKPYEQVVREMIFMPLKMIHSGFDFAHLKDVNKAIGYAFMNGEEAKRERLVDSTVSYAAGSMYSTTSDLLLWHKALLSNTVIKQASLRKAITPYMDGFGYGWIIDSAFNKKVLHHNGGIFGFTSNIYRIEADNTCVIVLTNSGDTKIDKITHGIASILYNSPVEFPQKRKEIKIIRSSARKYFGLYEFNPGFEMQIFSTGDKIFAKRVNEAEKFQLFYYKQDCFYLKQMDAQLEFRQQSNKGYEELVLHQEGREMKAKLVEAKPFDLYDTIMELDARLFEGYNSRDLNTMKEMFSPGLTFYHDVGGLSGYEDNIQLFKRNFARETSMRRELKPGSAAVYPIGNYGAIELGTSIYYTKAKGEEERYDSSPSFIHIWERIRDGWKLVKVVSYDH